MRKIQELVVLATLLLSLVETKAWRMHSVVLMFKRRGLQERSCYVGVQAVLEEFGKWIKAGTSATQAERDQFYQAAYQAVFTVKGLSSQHQSPPVIY